jgi:hypothetical protein
MYTGLTEEGERYIYEEKKLVRKDRRTRSDGAGGVDY